MAKIDMKYKEESRARTCGNYLVEFLNTENPVDATKNFVKKVRDKFGLPIPIPKRLKRRVEEIETERSRMEELISELNEVDNLADSAKVHYYMVHYNFCCKPFVMVQEDGTITDNPIFDEGNQVNYYDVLTYCLITYLKINKHFRIIRKCQEETMCGKYFIAKYDKGQDKLKFCDAKCRARNARIKKRTHILQFYNYAYLLTKRLDPLTFLIYFMGMMKYKLS